MKPSRRGLGPALPALAALAGLLLLSGCLAPEKGGDRYLRFENPELTADLDSLRVAGVNTAKGDTVPIHLWRKGETFPSQVAYPPGLEDVFTLLVQGYKGEVLVYQSRSDVAGDKAQAPVRDLRLVAPALTDVPVSLQARVKDALTLKPTWEARPGLIQQGDSGKEAFVYEATHTWTRGGQVLGRDSVLPLAALGLADAGTYLFTAENRAGRDSLLFELAVRHMLPKLGTIAAQAAIAGRALTVRPQVTRSDSLHYRWMQGTRLRSRDTALVLPALAATDTGSWQLQVLNASDTTETAVSNRFTVGFAPDPDAVWKAEKSVTVGAQANSGNGTSLDFDPATPKAMFYSEAVGKQATIDLLFVFSGGALKLMSAPAVKRAGDLSYADDFEDARIVDVKFVRVAAKPATPAAGRAAYDAGSKVNSLAVAAGQGFLVKTTDNNLAWVRIASIEGGAGASAAANLTVALGAY